MEELREWLKLWRGFPGAVVKGWVVILLVVLLWPLVHR